MSAHDTALLAETPLFARLDDVERTELADLLVVKSYTAGETVFYPGDPGDGLYLVRSGRVQAELEIAQLHRKMDRLSELLQGHFARGMPAPSINGTPARVHQDEEIIHDR